MIRILTALRGRSAHRRPSVGPRRIDRVARPYCEGLENRALMTFDFTSALGVGTADILAKGVRTDSVGNNFVVGGFSGTVNLDPSGSAAGSLTSRGGRDIFAAKYSPAGALLWAKGFGGAGDDLANALALDASGNLYLAGQYQASAAFGAATLSSAGGSDAFVAKLDGNGNVAWASGAGGAGADQAAAVAVDALGDVAVSGSFQGPASFGAATLAGAGGSDAFVAKYSAATGALAWAKGLGGTGTDGATGVGLDAAGNVYAGGSFYGSAAFGGTTLTSAGSYDAFVAKLDAAGNVAWAKGFGGAGVDQAKGLAVDAAGNAYLTGQFQSTANFGGVALTSVGGFDAYAVKVTTSGATAWAKGFGGTGNDQGMAVAVNPTTGTTTVGGQFYGTAAIGGTTLTSFGNGDAFITQFDSAGNSVMAKGFGGSGNDQVTAIGVDAVGNVSTVGGYVGPVKFNTTVLQNLGSTNMFVARMQANVASASADGLTSVVGVGAGDLVSSATAVDAAGNSYIAGGFSGTVNLDPSRSAAGSLTSRGGRDIFAAKYSPAGALLWAKGFGGAGDDKASALALDASGNLYLAGQYQASAAFGAATLNSAGGSDAFVAKLDGNGNVAWASGAGGAGADQAAAVAVDALGDVAVSGSFQGPASFGAATLSSAGGSDAFVAKYSAATGALAWAKGLGGTGTDGATGVGLDAAGNVYAGGSFYGSAAFGGTTLTSAGSYDAFVAKLDAAGNVAWAKGFGGAGVDQAKGLAVDAAGNAYLTGQFQSTANFGGVALTSVGGFDAYAVKVTTSGATAWAKGFGGTGNDQGMAVAVNSTTGAVTLGGQFYGTAVIGGSTLTSFGGGDAFVTRVDANGNFLWAKGFGGSGNDQVASIALDALGGYRSTGSYVGPAYFGNTVLPNAGITNVFLVNSIDPTKIVK